MCGRDSRSRSPSTAYPGVTWHGTVESISPAGRAGILAAAGAKYQRQLGQGRAARADAGSRRCRRQEQAAAARRHERHRQRRYRSRARFPALLVTAVADPSTDVPNRGMITLCVILATLMQALDTTIANVALPYMQGSVSASQDQIDWVLTSYIVAAAIMTPPTGFLASRFGLKRLVPGLGRPASPWRRCCAAWRRR